MEFVWVVRRCDLFRSSTPHGFVQTSSSHFEAAWLETCVQKGFFVERREAELSPEWQQIIPYCVINTPEGVLCVERLAKGSEKRLTGMLSIGIGGHIEPCDLEAARETNASDAGTLLEAAATREICEELCLDEVSQLEVLGLINDDTSPVGAVHVGIAFRTELSFVPEVREVDRLATRPTPLVKLRGMCHTHREFESWSQFILDSWTDPFDR